MLKKFVYLSVILLISLIDRNECSHLSRHKRMTPADVCNSNECRPYGTCEVLSPTTYKCHCRAGVTGTNCNQVSQTGNPCDSSPCYNGGVCANVGTTSFTCTCPSGLTGTTCKQTIGTTCLCQNSGTCTTTTTNGVTSNECNCPSGFGGNLCEYQIGGTQNCFTAGCLNGGTCTILSTCVCPTGFTGSRCQTSSSVTTTTATAVTAISIPLCFAGICQNGGTCTQTGNIGVCTCQTGYTGLYCNLPSGVTTTAATTTVATTTVATTTVATTTVAQTLACPSSIASTFCQNGGQCTYDTSTNNFICNCLPNFSGPVCATKVPFCSVSPCQNGGTCVTTNSPATGDGQCTCVTGFQGAYCNVVACDAATTCSGNGVCLNSGTGNNCLCFAGFGGSDCSTNI